MSTHQERREDLISRLAVLEAKHEEHHSRVFGNGQPGELEKVERKILKMIEQERVEGMNQHADMKKRIGRLERIAYIGFGVLVALNFIRGIPDFIKSFMGGP